MYHLLWHAKNVDTYVFMYVAFRVRCFSHCWRCVLFYVHTYRCFCFYRILCIGQRNQLNKSLVSLTIWVLYNERHNKLLFYIWRIFKCWRLSFFKRYWESGKNRSEILVRLIVSEYFFFSFIFKLTPFIDLEHHTIRESKKFHALKRLVCNANGKTIELFFICIYLYISKQNHFSETIQFCKVGNVTQINSDQWINVFGVSKGSLANPKHIIFTAIRPKNGDRTYRPETHSDGRSLPGVMQCSLGKLWVHLVFTYLSFHENCISW